MKFAQKVCRFNFLVMLSSGDSYSSYFISFRLVGLALLTFLILKDGLDVSSSCVRGRLLLIRWLSMENTPMLLDRMLSASTLLGLRRRLLMRMADF